MVERRRQLFRWRKVIGLMTFCHTKKVGINIVHYIVRPSPNGVVELVQKNNIGEI